MAILIAVAEALLRVARWVDVVAEILSEPIRDFPLGRVGRGLLETFSADVATRTWRTEKGRPGFDAVARPGALFAGRTIDGAGRSITTTVDWDLLDHHPLIRWYRLTGNLRPQTMDRVPRAMPLMPRSADVVRIMQEYGVARQMAIPLSRPGREGAALVVCRSAGEDFCDEDLEVADRIAPLFRALRTQSDVLRADTRGTAESSLSGRELAVLVLLARGLTSAAIASHLDCAPRTVEKHLEHMYRKLQVSDRVSAVRVAHDMGILQSPGTPEGTHGARTRNAGARASDRAGGPSRT